MSFGGGRTSRTYEELRRAIDSGALAKLTNDDARYVIFQVADPDCFKAWSDCMQDQNRIASSLRVSARENGDTIVFTISYVPQDLADPAPIVTSVFLRGASADPQSQLHLHPGTRIRHSLVYPCTRGDGPVTLCIQTTRGPAITTVDARPNEEDKAREENCEKWRQYDEEKATCDGRLAEWQQATSAAAAENSRLNQTHTSGPLGGEGGHPFHTVVLPSGNHITSVYGRAGDYIDNIGFRYIDPEEVEHDTGLVGRGTGGAPFEFTVSRDDRLVGISVYCGKYVDAIILETNNGYSQRFGGGGGRSCGEIGSRDNEIVGLFGNCGDYIDKIAVVSRAQNQGVVPTPERPDCAPRMPEVERPPDCDQGGRWG